MEIVTLAQNRKLKYLPKLKRIKNYPINSTVCMPKVILFRSYINDVPFILRSLMVLIFFIGLFLVIGEAFYQKIELYRYQVILYALCIGVLLITAVVLFRHYNVRYYIADDGVKALRGIYTNNQVDVKLEYYQIRGTEIHRNFFERAVGTGNLHIRGTSGNETDVSFHGIFNPYRYQKLIQEKHRTEVELSQSIKESA